jgi:methylmalonyl-CoA mutase cobalamin-binding domain/chain
MTSTAETVRHAASKANEAPLRFVTAASLFDGHDAAINLMRRLIQAEGCEVVHLGHNRSVAEIVRAAICEDADGIAVSSYQGGHNEYFKYMVDMLAEQGASHIQVFGGGGGTITPEEIRALEAHGVNRIYHPDDGMKMGLKEMIGDLVGRTRQARKDRLTGAASLDGGGRDSGLGTRDSLLVAPGHGQDQGLRAVTDWSLRSDPGGFSESRVPNQLRHKYITSKSFPRLAAMTSLCPPIIHFGRTRPWPWFPLNSSTCNASSRTCASH